MQASAKVEPRPGDPAITPALIAEHGLTPDEYRRLVDMLGREPTFTELGIVSALWSEHCSYKHSRPLLKTLPTTAPFVLQGPGENAGVISIGDGLAVAFKIESHNHPSAVEPYQGAATGVGGILRDVFTMGARPIAMLNSLRFGSLDSARVRYLFGGVVKGIGDYGNCVGIPTVAGEVSFDPAYEGNPLVNAMCVGLMHEDELIRAVAQGVGNPIIAVGARTGRDGIHGASFASEDLSAQSDAKRPRVQVGDPFTEKLLLEASLELIRSGAIVAIQDMGAAGLTSSSAEMAARGDVGVTIDTTKVPVRETGMTPYEILLSESQERMLVVAKRGREDEVAAILSKWDLTAAVIGEVIAEPVYRVTEGERVVAEFPGTRLVTDCPTYTPDAQESETIRERARARRQRDRRAAGGARPAVDARSDALFAEHRVQDVGLPAVRHDRSHEHRRRPRRRRRRRARARHRPRSRAQDGLQRALRLPRSARRRPDRRVRGGEKRGVHRWPAEGDHEQLELRKSATPRGLLPVARGRPRDGGGVRRAGNAGHRRQRVALQREPWRRRVPHPGHRDGRRRRVARARDPRAVPRRRATRSYCWVHPPITSAAASICRESMESSRARPRRATSTTSAS